MMAGKTVGIDIEVHLVDGSSSTFVQSDPAAIDRILKDLDPKRQIFDRPRISFEGSASVTVIPVASIARLNVHAEPALEWPAGPFGGQVLEIGKEDLLAKYRPDEDESLTRKAKRKPGDRFHGFAHMILANREHLVMEIESLVSDPMDQRMAVNRVWSRSTIHIRRAGGGCTIINIANLLRLDLLPGQPEVAPGAWPAELIASRDA